MVLYRIFFTSYQLGRSHLYYCKQWQNHISAWSMIGPVPKHKKLSSCTHLWPVSHNSVYKVESVERDTYDLVLNCKSFIKFIHYGWWMLRGWIVILDIYLHRRTSSMCRNILRATWCAPGILLTSCMHTAL